MILLSCVEIKTKVSFSIYLYNFQFIRSTFKVKEIMTKIKYRCNCDISLKHCLELMILRGDDNVELEIQIFLIYILY